MYTLVARTFLLLIGGSYFSIRVLSLISSAFLRIPFFCFVSFCIDFAFFSTKASAIVSHSVSCGTRTRTGFDCPKAISSFLLFFCSCCCFCLRVRTLYGLMAVYFGARLRETREDFFLPPLDNLFNFALISESRGVPCGVVITCPAHKPEGLGSIPGLVDGNHGVKSETPSLAAPVVSQQQ